MKYERTGSLISVAEGRVGAVIDLSGTFAGRSSSVLSIVFVIAATL